MEELDKETLEILDKLRLFYSGKLKVNELPDGATVKSLFETNESFKKAYHSDPIVKAHLNKMREIEETCPELDEKLWLETIKHGINKYGKNCPEELCKICFDICKQLGIECDALTRDKTKK